MAFDPIFKPFAVRPKSQYFSNPYLLLALIKDNFALHTWLLIGALLQGCVSLLPYRNITLIFPVVLFLSYKIIRAVAMTMGFISNPYMGGVVLGRTVPVYPSEKDAAESPAESSLCAIMLAVRSNHPLGIFGPGYKEIGDMFKGMVAELDAGASSNGFLGSSACLSCHDRAVASEFMSMVYFENEDKLHEFSHGPTHTAATEWWVRTLKEHDHISIMHEVYAAPRKSWEGIYVNYAPTGLGATTKMTMVDGKQVWVNPLVRGKGRLSYSKGRMGRVFDNKSEWQAIDREAYDQQDP
ncbi:hypothetical protein MBLNU457_4774t1 [Dothideomycetes sp. NU457]